MRIERAQVFIPGTWLERLDDCLERCVGGVFYLLNSGNDDVVMAFIR